MGSKIRNIVNSAGDMMSRETLVAFLRRAGYRPAEDITATATRWPPPGRCLARHTASPQRQTLRRLGTPLRPRQKTHDPGRRQKRLQSLPLQRLDRIHPNIGSVERLAVDTKSCVKTDTSPSRHSAVRYTGYAAQSLTRQMGRGQH